MAITKGDRGVIRAWCWFDWANSVYPLVITTAVFPLYFEAIIPDTVSFLGMSVKSTVLYSYSISFSFLLVSMLSPILSGVADYSGNKKVFMKYFSTIGAIASASLFLFVGESNLWLGLGGSVVASIGFSGSLVFYNAFLPEIAREDQLDMVSARGFTMGYIGSSLLLIICLAMITMHETFGFESEAFPTRLSFLLSGIWWFSFALITFKGLPDNILDVKPPKVNLLTKGFQELKGVFQQLKNQPRLKLFLLAFFFYSMGYMTVIYLATLFGSNVLGLGTTELIATVLIIQFVGIAGAYFFAYLAGKIGNLSTIMVVVIIWMLVCFGTYFVDSGMAFYVVAFFVGTVMGGIQSLSRSTYAKLLPETHDHASYYSFYDITEKVGITVGSFSFGLVETMTGSMRVSALFLAVYFLVGLVLLGFVRRMGGRVG